MRLGLIQRAIEGTPAQAYMLRFHAVVRTPQLILLLYLLSPWLQHLLILDDKSTQTPVFLLPSFLRALSDQSTHRDAFTTGWNAVIAATGFAYQFLDFEQHQNDIVNFGDRSPLDDPVTWPDETGYR